MRATEGAVLLLAVPGSGKTTVLVTRLGYMTLALGIAPGKILTMTYTVAAARDMKNRFSAMFGEQAAAGLDFRTINAVAVQIIGSYERRYGRKAFELLSDSSRQAALIGEIYREKCRDFATESVIKEIQTAITYAKNMMLSDSELEELKSETENFPDIYRAYDRTLREHGLMDYDDQLVYAYRILKKYPDILADFQERCHYICVDEAQDTSKIQHEIIRLLAQKRQNIFMVGDEDQSIYGFRAAYPQALMEFEKRYHGAKVLLLEKNFRSTSQIVAAADGFIRRNTLRHEKHMTAQRGAGKNVNEISVYNRRAQYRYLLETARSCEKETAVLYRDNDSALPLIDLLEREGIAYRRRQMDSLFFSSKIVRDVEDIIKFALHPTDGERFLRIYYKFSAGISKAAAESAASASAINGRPVLDVLAGLPGISGWTKKNCLSLSTHLNNMLGEAAERAMYRIENFMGYGEYLDSRGADRNKLQILSILSGSLSSPVKLMERLEELYDIVRNGGTDTGGSLILSTIHSSKGLEYDRVFLLDASDGILPRTELPRDRAVKREELEAYEEERRLFYVGMTRAKDELNIFHVKQRGVDSAFVSELFPDKKTVSKINSEAKIKSPVKRDLDRETEKYQQGCSVLHRAFGPGRIISRTGDVLSIRFVTGEKKILLSSALRSSQLSILE